MIAQGQRSGATSRRMIATGVVVVAACTGALSCSGDGPTAPQLADVSVSLGTNTLEVGQTANAAAIMRDAAGAPMNGLTVTWLSSNPGVASVNMSGVIAAVAPGSAQISATAQGVTGSATVTVIPVPVASVRVTLDHGSITAVDSARASAVVLDAAGHELTGRAVQWTSSDSTVATVSAAGSVSAVSPGTTLISATSEGRTGSASLTVRPAPVASVSVSLASTSLLIGQSTQATATLRDARGGALTARQVTWTAAPEGIATVSPSGVVTATGEGAATITASSEGHSGTATLTSAPVPVAAIEVGLQPSTVIAGFTAQASATLRDSVGGVLAGRAVVWSAGDARIAIVAQDGVISAIAPGTTTITASREGKSASAVLTVLRVPVATVTVALVSPTITAVESTRATATLRDARGNELTGRETAWTSSDPAVATIAADGAISGVRAGTTSIAATSEGQTGSATLTVTPAPVASVTVAISSSVVPLGDTTHAEAVLRDAADVVLSGRAITWTSGSQAVADVLPSGVIVTRDVGTTTVTATSEGKSGSAVLTVVPAPVATVDVELGATSVTAVGGTQATAVLRDALHNVLRGRTIAWASSDPSVATISAEGGVSALHEGTTTITATSEGRSGFASLTVTPAPVAVVAVVLARNTVIAGEASKATATLRDVRGDALTNRTVAWRSDDAAVASISDAGIVSTHAPGSATIAATSEGVTGTAVLTVIPAPVDRVEVTLAVTAVTAVGATQASATLHDARGNVLTGRAVSWASSDPSIASITADGIVSAAHEGTTTITATSEGRSGSALLTVTAAPVASVDVILTPANVWAGQASQAAATLRDARGDVLIGRAVTWASSDATIATVAGDGAVTSLAAGRATITASSEGRSGSAPLTVAPAPVASVSVSLAAGSITAIDSTVATATIRDPNGKLLAGRAVMWASSADSIATISSAGVVRAERVGTTTITATSEGTTGSVELTVTPAPVASVAVSLSRASILAGEGSQASAALTDNRARVLSGRVVTWSTDAPTKAAISATGAITSLAAGTVTIKATSEGQTGEATLIISPVPVAVVSVVVSPSSVTAGDSARATATMLDSVGGPLAGRIVSWRSDDTTVAIVDANGVVATVSPGTTTITATSEGHSGSATLSVTPVPVASVAVTVASDRVIAGQTTRATAILKGARGNVLQGRPIAWATDAPAVATVDTDGVVSGVAPGVANILASSESHSASTQVTIVPVPVARVTVSLASTSLIEGQGTQASAVTLDSVGHPLAGRAVTWSSDNLAVATVSVTGAVTTLTSGTVRIVGESEGMSGSATLDVLPIPVARVVVTLGTETIHAGLTTTATAAVFDSAGNQLLNRIVEWTSDNPNVASISSAGVVSAHFQGIAEIGATSGGVTGSRVLTVTPAPIASVTVALASTVLDVGQGTTASVVLHDSLGNVLTERPVTWSSDDVAVATVSVTGVVTATGPGSAHIIATVEGENGSVLLTVTSATPSAEPVGLTPLTQRSFDAVEEDGWMTTPASLPYYTIANDPTAPRSPSHVAQIRYPAGWLGGDSPGLTGRDLGNATTIYLSMWVKLSPNWVGHPTGTNKIIHLWISHINRVYLVADGSDANVLTPRIGLQRIAGSYDNGFGTIGDALDLRPNLPGQLDVEIVRGRWHHWEVVLTSNTDGLPNGTVDWWLDGVHVGQYTGIPFVDATETRTWDYIGFDPTWGGRDGMLDQEQSIFMDHIYVSGKP